LVWRAPARPLDRSGVSASCRGRHWPVVFGDAGPEDPDHDDGEQSEESREEAAVDGAVGAVADVYADHVLEYLADGEKEGSANEVHCTGFSEDLGKEVGKL
jgi:hypothetical protein